MSVMDFGARAMACQAAMLAARPMPSVPVLGDSITAQYSTSDGVTTAFNAKGDLVWARAILGGRFLFSPALNFGVSGEASAQILARAASVIAAKPGFYRVLMGTDDPVPGATFSSAATWANIRACYDQLIAAGIVVLAAPILRRSFANGLSAGELANAQKSFLWINRMIRRYAMAARPGTLYVVDYDRALLDQTSASHTPVALSTAEGMHPLAASAYWLGEALAAVLDPLLPPMSLGIVAQHRARPCRTGSVEQNTSASCRSPSNDAGPTHRGIGLSRYSLL